MDQMEIEKIDEEMRVDMEEKNQEMKKKKMMKSMKIVEKLMEQGKRKEWMIMKIVKVIKKDMRKIVKMDGGSFEKQDIKDIYRRVIKSKKSMKRMIEMREKGIIIRKEKRMLKEDVDEMLEKGSRGRVIKGEKKRKMKQM